MDTRTKPYQTKEERIYRAFADELKEWSRAGTKPSLGNQDISYYLELQEERLKERGLKMEYQMKLRGEHLDKIYSTFYRDPVYTNVFAVSRYLLKTTFFREGKTVYERKEPQNFFLTITKMDQQRPEENCCCPNCGVVSPVKELLEGCPHCHTRFLMSDLFPKVTGYFFQLDFALNSKEYHAKVRKWVIGGILAIFLLFWVFALIQGQDFPILQVLLGSIPVGAFTGYLLMSLNMAVGFFGYAERNMPQFIRTAGTKGKLSRLLQPYDKSFSYEYFTGRILSLLKVMIYSDQIKNLAVYVGEEKIPDCSDIVESVYQGSMRLNRKWMEKGYCYLDLSIDMINTYDAGRIYRKNDRFRMVVCKKLRRDSDFGFSIKKVQCGGCRGSFDATRERFCPYCGREYYLKDDDWVVVKFHKK